MAMMRFASLVLALAASLAGCSNAVREDQAEKPELGLVTSLPIYWAEIGSPEQMLDAAQETGAVRAALEQDYRLVPLDTLGDTAGEGTPNVQFAALDLLLLAQPAAMAPAELVALDAWVRAGGHAMIFADPMATAESQFGFGDRRRPQAATTLGPLFARWGLKLEYDPNQPSTARMVAFEPGGRIGAEVILPGQFSLMQSEASDVECALRGGGVLALCSIGEGRVALLADAAMLEGGSHAHHGHDHGAEDEDHAVADEIRLRALLAWGLAQ